jgi:hypothetical protein
VQIHRWRPGVDDADQDRELAAYGGLGRKP